MEVTPRRNFGHSPWLAQPKVEEVVEAWKEASETSGHEGLGGGIH